jgi:Kef-type K+ transport system membrane component KefB
VENFSKYGDELITAIERTSMTVYVIFFAIAGASINFGTLGSMWLIAFALVISRAMAFAGGNWIAGTVWKEPPLIKRYSWMGYLGQAGVSLGIASIVLRTYPKVGSVFYTVVVAAIAINQIIGPITLKYLLGRAGETAENRSLIEFSTNAKISMALPDKEDEQDARKRSHSYVEDVLRNLTRSDRCQ